MLHLQFNQPIKNLALIALALTISLNSIAGGDTYEIYLNNKLVVTWEHAGELSKSSTIHLDKSNYNDHLVIYYRHCGTTGKGRNIIVKDEQDRILQEWKFADAKGSNASMIIPVKEILNLKKKNADVTLNLYYASSAQLPKARMLASINLNKERMVHFNRSKSAIVLTAGIFGLVTASWILRNKLSQD